MGLPDKPSIVVLPFANLSDDPEQEFFADCLVDDIITDLSHDRSLFVIARNSSFTYKGRAVDVKMAGRELGVRYVYDQAVQNVFTMQDEITSAVASAINPAISHAERQRDTEAGGKPERLGGMA